MATQAKKVEAKKEEVEPKKTLQENLNDITFKNAQIHKLRAAQDENKRLKLREQMGRKKLGRGETPFSGVKGLQRLQGLGNSLGRQFKKPNEE